MLACDWNGFQDGLTRVVNSAKDGEVAMDIRSLQKPLKEQYRNDPDASRITIRAKGAQMDAPVACSYNIGVATIIPKPQREAEAGVTVPGPATLFLGAVP